MDLRPNLGVQCLSEFSLFVSFKYLSTLIHHHLSGGEVLEEVVVHERVADELLGARALLHLLQGEAGARVEALARHPLLLRVRVLAKVVISGIERLRDQYLGKRIQGYFVPLTCPAME